MFYPILALSTSGHKYLVLEIWPFCKCCSINLLMKVTLMWWASLVTTNWVLGGLAEVIHGWVRILAADGLLEGSTSNIWRTRSWEQKKCESEVIIYDEISKVRFKRRKCHVTQYCPLNVVSNFDIFKRAPRAQLGKL